uniref:Uncharacterized protein n=1 Tax=Triticum urartu TaxID=4572 RepID=A0A8R7UD21_TRIUA
MSPPPPATPCMLRMPPPLQQWCCCCCYCDSRGAAAQRWRAMVVSVAPSCSQQWVVFPMARIR